MKREELIHKAKELLHSTSPVWEKLSDASITKQVLVEFAADFHLSLPPAAKGEAQRCPVCGGNGIVPNGFYNQTSWSWSTSDIAPEVCRSCQGTGIVWG
jgi:hypothetical protein